MLTTTKTIILLFDWTSIISHNGIIVIETIGLEGLCTVWIHPTYIIAFSILNRKEEN